MKKGFGILMAGLILAFSGSAQAQEMAVSVEGAVDGYYQYIWRGYNLGDKSVLQPSLTFGFGETGLAVNVWGSAAMQSRGRLEATDELDFTASLDRSLGEDSPVGISLGYIQYTFPNAGAGSKHSEEVYGGLSLDHTIAPSLTFYYDFGLVDGWYIAAGIAPEFPLGEEEGAPTLSLSASVAMSDYGGDSGFNDFTASASISFTSGVFTFSPIVGYAYAADLINPNNSEVWGGISISFTK